jgi:hypothetical protein
VRHYLGWIVGSTRTGKKNYVFNNVGYPPNAITVIKLKQARWAKITASAENCKVFAGKAEGLGLQNLGWREGREYVQYSDGYERR